MTIVALIDLSTRRQAPVPQLVKSKPGKSLQSFCVSLRVVYVVIIGFASDIASLFFIFSINKSLDRQDMRVYNGTRRARAGNAVRTVGWAG